MAVRPISMGVNQPTKASPDLVATDEAMDRRRREVPKMEESGFEGILWLTYLTLPQLRHLSARRTIFRLGGTWRVVWWPPHRYDT